MLNRGTSAMRRTPMKRGNGMRNRAPKHLGRDPERKRTMPTVTLGAFRASQAVATAPAARVEKSDLVRSPTYRRLVAALPCMYCGRPGPSQHAHGNAGKGMAIKTSDLDGFPLCADRPLERGCHSLYDQGALLSKEDRHRLEPVWAARTQRTVFATGKWPKRLPYPFAAEAAR